MSPSPLSTMISEDWIDIFLKMKCLQTVTFYTEDETFTGSTEKEWNGRGSLPIDVNRHAYIGLESAQKAVEETCAVDWPGWKVWFCRPERLTDDKLEIGLGTLCDIGMSWRGFGNRSWLYPFIK